MKPEHRILNVLAPGYDPVQVQTGRFTLSKRVDSSQKYNMVKTGVAPGNDTRPEITASDTGLDF